MHERVRVSPIWEYIWPSGIGRGGSFSARLKLSKVDLDRESSSGWLESGREPRPPLLDRMCVLWIVPVRIEAEPMAEASIAAELIFGDAFDELDQPVVNVPLVPEHLEQR